jgi:hypothetical protein
MEKKYLYIRAQGIRKEMKQHEKQCSADFLNALDRFVFSLLLRAIKASGAQKRIGAELIE